MYKPNYRLILVGVRGGVTVFFFFLILDIRTNDVDQWNTKIEESEWVVYGGPQMYKVKL